MLEGLTAEIAEVQRLMARLDEGFIWSRKDDNRYYKVLYMLASHLPSPSKLNAYSVLKSNTPQKIAQWLEERRCT